MIARIETPCGPLWLSGGKDSVGSVSWSPLEGQAHHGEMDWLLGALDDYFAGKIDKLPGSVLFSNSGPLWVRRPVDSQPLTGSQQILAAVGKIPYGTAVSYSQVASSAGRAGAARAVGAVCRSNPLPLLIPCHRVVGRHTMGGYTPSIHIKEMLLRHEGALK